MIVFENEIDATTFDNANFLSSIEIREIRDIQEKRKWLECFLAEYKGGKRSLKTEMWGKDTRFFVACQQGKQLGFIRLIDYSAVFCNIYSGAVWGAADAFVKKAYRSRGVLWTLLNYVITNCDVKIARLDCDRIVSNSHYYKSLGFNNIWVLDDSNLVTAVIDSFKDEAGMYFNRET